MARGRGPPGTGIGSAGGQEARAAAPPDRRSAPDRAEAVGFEPTVPGGTTVFETVRFGRSRTPPAQRLTGRHPASPCGRRAAAGWSPTQRRPRRTPQQVGALVAEHPAGHRHLVVEAGVGSTGCRGCRRPRPWGRRPRRPGAPTRGGHQRAGAHRARLERHHQGQRRRAASRPAASRRRAGPAARRGRWVAPQLALVVAGGARPRRRPAPPPRRARRRGPGPAPPRQGQAHGSSSDIAAGAVMGRTSARSPGAGRRGTSGGGGGI